MNKILGKIVEISSSENISLIAVDTGSRVLHSLVVETPETAKYLKIGEKIYLIIKETEVALAREIQNCQTSFLNQINCIVEKIISGKVLSKIVLNCETCQLKAILPTEAIKQMKLKENENVVALIKANEITIMEADG
ncbi:TOBE domain-containing protein [Persephonella sp. KM09-Lau-8]|uniref:TOBE domain-containing protein n=1 Tax=Persephonella sp. KM09-Lau-8 TaxID=1158345 RepID=UPI0004954AD1|nr:TOBE domain-containing protein [Persephonella sp. KM09-Lau-8]